MFLYCTILIISAFCLTACFNGVVKNTLAQSPSQNTNGYHSKVYDSVSFVNEVTREQVINEFAKIMEPEIGVSIIELELVDYVEVNEGNVVIGIHFTSPFSPAAFAFRIAEEIRDSISSLPQVNDVKIETNNHFMAEAIEQHVNQPKPTEGN